MSTINVGTKSDLTVCSQMEIFCPTAHTFYFDLCLWTLNIQFVLL